jgi:hypothetical protein
VTIHLHPYGDFIHHVPGLVFSLHSLVFLTAFSSLLQRENFFSLLVLPWSVTEVWLCVCVSVCVSCVTANAGSQWDAPSFTLIYTSVLRKQGRWPLTHNGMVI